MSQRLCVTLRLAGTTILTVSDDMSEAPRGGEGLSGVRGWVGDARKLALTRTRDRVVNSHAPVHGPKPPTMTDSDYPS